MKTWTVTRATVEYSFCIVEAESESEAIAAAKGGEGEWTFVSYADDGYLEEQIPGYVEYEAEEREA